MLKRPFHQLGSKVTKTQYIVETQQNSTNLKTEAQTLIAYNL